MANPKRLMILWSLVRGEVPVGILASHVGLSQPALSQHLSKLRAQKLMKTRRNAQTIYYSSSSEQVMEVLTTPESYLLRHQESQVGGILGRQPLLRGQKANINY
jgi:DNA-binding transcriptional ArsR family regulator